MGPSGQRARRSQEALRRVHKQNSVCAWGNAHNLKSIFPMCYFLFRARRHAAGRRSFQRRRSKALDYRRFPTSSLSHPNVPSTLFSFSTEHTSEQRASRSSRRSKCGRTTSTISWSGCWRSTRTGASPPRPLSATAFLPPCGRRGLQCLQLLHKMARDRPDSVSCRGTHLSLRESAYAFLSLVQARYTSW